MASNKPLWRCGKCGFPYLVSLVNRWNSDGTMTQRLRRSYRIVIFPTEFLHGLFSNIEARLGLSIEHLAFEAQLNASKMLFLSVPGSRLLSRPAFAKRICVDQFNRLAMLTGMGLSKTIEYEPGRIGIARMTNPFQLQLMAANVVGAFEFLERCPFEYSWEEESSNVFVITVRPSPDKPEIAERLKLEFPPRLPGDLKFDRCPRCHVPLAVTYLKWKENEGTIIDTRTGARFMVSDGHMFNAVFRELEKELGEEVNLMLVDAQREWTARHVELLGLSPGDEALDGDELKGAYRRYLDTLPAYGQGNPVNLELLSPGVRVEILNPYQKFILAGTLQGLYEALEKTGSAVEWKERIPGAVTYTVRPA